MNTDEVQSTTSTADDSLSLKQLLDKESRELVEIIKRQEADLAKDTKPVGILGRWLHTNTS